MRIGLGITMLLTLLRALPLARYYFLSERWGGYGERGWRVDLVQNPIVMPVVYVGWLAANAALIAEAYPVVAAAFNLAACYYFFIAMRWRGVLRGMGAPGFIACWLSFAVFLIELTRRHAPGVEGLAVLALQVDFALIMLAAGIYKFTAGYRYGDGMELGMVNPEWGYWGRFWSRVSPSHPIFRFFNEMAWGTEVVAALLMLVPQTRFLGALIMALSFVFIATQIRLGYLCEMVIISCLVFFHHGSLGDVLLSAVIPAPAAAPATENATLASILIVVLWTYILLLPFARAGMSYNLYAKKALPRLLQRALDLYTNACGLILWRVFSADHTNFFVRIYEQPAGGGDRRLISNWTAHRQYHGRYNQVAEGITVTTLFTTLKYYPSNNAMFVERLLRYARTVPHHRGNELVFEHVSVIKNADGFAFAPAAEFIVDVDRGTVREVTIDPSRPVRATIAASPVHEGVRPGSYAPLRS